MSPTVTLDRADVEKLRRLFGSASGMPYSHYRALLSRVDAALAQSAAPAPAAADARVEDGKVPDRETFWLVERNVSPPQYVSTNSASWHYDVWEARRFQTEREAHDYWRMMGALERAQFKVVEHLFTNKIGDALPPSPAPLPATEDIAGDLFFIPYERKDGSWDMGGPFLDRAEAEKYRARDYKHVNAGVVRARARDVANTLSALRAAGKPEDGG